MCFGGNKRNGILVKSKILTKVSTQEACSFRLSKNMAVSDAQEVYHNTRYVQDQGIWFSSSV